MEHFMYFYTLLTIVPHTSNWSLQNSLIMIICNLITISIGRYAIQVRGLGPSIPVLSQEGFGLPELIATTSLGHILGAGVIIGLNTVSVIN
uniref:Photosystem I reaction center subunit PsaK n=1 Tax=Gastroclonium compressum TaxID=1852973 RepID=A0A173FZW6_GASCM|nr:photosystem I reaction center subunit X [Coeloseira compressa]ANH09576.1 photosystem I reaction center subunit X [Coeloseira compressa]